MPLNKVQQLADLPFISSLSTSFWPPPKLHLTESVPDTRANLVWQMTDNSGRKVTGKGITVASHDTGVDLFHPDFFRNNPNDPAQTPKSWTDLGQAGYHPGEDVVVGYESEGFLNHINATGAQGNTGDFDWRVDFLYIDRPPGQGLVNHRDKGVDDGFSETSPSYGEKLFIVDDFNNSGVFDGADKLVPIWTSKFYAIYYLPDGQSVPIRRQRGLDLIRAARDTNGHGTWTTGAMAGGRVEESKSTQNRAYIGMAPDADYIMGNWEKKWNQEYEGVSLRQFQEWAEGDNAKVMNYSWGFPLYWQFLDGSSDAEGRIDEMALAGIPQVVSAGNEAALDVHFYRAAIPRRQTVSATFEVPAIPPPPPGQPDERVKWIKQSLLWLSSKGTNVSILVTRPGGASKVLVLGSETWQEEILDTDKLRWSTHFSGASDPMVRVDIWITNVIDTEPIQTGPWTISATNWNGTEQNPISTDIDGYMGDSREVVRFSGNYVTNLRTMTSPATATHSIAVGAHTDGANGPIANFSSRGPRINGGKTIDITAPGVDITSTDSEARTGGTYGGYITSGGTSFSAPHVAGAIALMLQDNPVLTATQIKDRLKQTALKDGATTNNPNPDIWGAGKLNIYTALTKASPKLVNDSIDPSDSVAVSKVNVQALKNYYTGATIPGATVPGGLGSYEATVDFDVAGVSILGVRAVAPFNISSQINGGRVTLSGSQAGSQPQLPVNVANLVVRLIGSKNESYGMTLNFQKIKGVNNDVFNQEGPYNISGLRRGDAQVNGVVNITDALFIAQYLANLRGLGETINDVHPINAASPRQDGATGDKVSIHDAMFIAQMCAGLRDASYNLPLAKAAEARAARSRTIVTSTGTTVEVGSSTLPPGANTQIPITVKNITDGGGMGAYDIKVTFNPQIVRIDNVTAGVYAEPTSGIDNINGTVMLNAYKPDMPGPTGDVIVAYLSVTALGGSGSSTPLDLSVTTLSNSYGDDIAATDVDGTVTINAAVPAVVVLSPNGGQSWDINSPSQNITWTASSGNGITGIDILYTASSGADGYPYTIAQGIANSGSFIWGPPLGVPPPPGLNILSPYMRIKIVAHDGLGNTGSDISEYNFTIKDDYAQAEIDLVPELDSSGYAVVTPNVVDLKNPSTQLVENIGDGLGSYNANVVHSVTPDSAGINIKSVAGIAPFSAPAAVLNEDIGNSQLRTSVQDSQTSSMPMLPRAVSWLRTFLLGSKDTAYTMTLNFTSITRTSGGTVPQQASKSRIFKRGDAKADGTVNIADCLYISQYLAGSRTLGDDTGTGSYTHTHPINSAGVAHDDETGDKITSADSLFISQMLAGLRDAYYNLIGGGKAAVQQAASKTVTVAGKTTVETGSATLATGTSVRIPITVKNIGDPLGLGSYNLKLAFDSKVIRIGKIESPDFAPTVVIGLNDVKPDVLALTCANIDNKGGKVAITAFKPAIPGPAGDVVIAYVTVTAIGTSKSVSPLTVSSVSLTNADGKNIPAIIASGSISIK